ncbi:LysR family transcriptional regulator [Undibacterium umbellatum]|uniref:LysR family transcriptional regulator n=1 Tax=Undibacterium umbellatum TaxID=2762300 RepID=A0ABR6Z673_9BURK|nr:LysR family transcriptional regulator [Undibacterium umbellatum]MBC3907278.1 LysR family transcriptional regulator [Undibacterium umbellatum]
MQFDQLRRMALFAQVVRHGSFSAASRALDLATSVLSAAVSQLEIELGVRLLHRTTRRLSLTEVGQDYYQQCVAMLAAAEAAQELIAESSGEIAGRLRISAASDVAENIILPALHPLTRAHPKLLLDIQVADNIVDMASQQIDLSIRSGWMRDSSLVARKLADLHEVLVASPAYLKKSGIPQHPEDLSRYQIIAMTRLSDPTTLTLKNKEGHTVKVSLPPSAMTDSVRLLVHMAVEGMGLARLPSYAVSQDLRANRLVTVLDSWQLPGAGIFAVTLKRGLQPQKVRAAIEALAQFLDAA